MEQDDQDLEEGEIPANSEDDVEVNNYTPLERPENYALAAPPKRFIEGSNQYGDNDDESQSSDSDSDSDTNLSFKQSKKMKLPKNPLPKRQNKAKKYDIWSTRAHEDILAETMDRCDVSLRDRSRGVESYDYAIARKYFKELEKKEQGTKRTGDNKKNYKFLPKKRLETEEKFNLEKNKKKCEALTKSVQLERNKSSPELLTRAELDANKNVKIEEENCTNQPPSTESDNHESGEVLEPQILPVIENNKKKDDVGELKFYDDDVLVINCCEDDMDLF